MAQSTPTPLLQLLDLMFPGIHFIDYFSPGEDLYYPGAGLDLAKFLRGRDYLKPVLIVGLDTIDMISPHHIDILTSGDNLSIFYLQLPCTSERLEETVKKTMEAPNALPFSRKMKVKIIRDFKHTCENVCMAKSANTQRAKKQIRQQPVDALKSLRELKMRRVKQLQVDFERLGPVINYLAVDQANRLPGLFEDLSNMTEQITENVIGPRQALDLSFLCVNKLQQITSILGTVKD